MPAAVVCIIVNGREIAVRGQRTLSYRWLAEIAGLGVYPSITYRLPDYYSGTLTEGDWISVVEGLIVNVADTSNA